MFFHFFLGKGGVGRSTLSFNYATQLAKKSPTEKILFVEFESQGFINYVLENLDVPQAVQNIHCLASNLYSLNLITDQCLREYLTYRLKVRPLVNVMMHSKLIKSFFEAAPGLDHMSKLGRIYNNYFQQYTDHFQTNEMKEVPEIFDQVVIDFAATGHGLYAIDTPRNFEKLFPIGSINQDAQRIARAIENPQLTQFHLVTLLDELPVLESIQLKQSMQKLGLKISNLWINQSLNKMVEIKEKATENDCETAQFELGSIKGNLLQAYQYEKQVQINYWKELSLEFDPLHTQIHEVGYESLTVEKLRSNLLEVRKS